MNFKDMKAELKKDDFFDNTLKLIMLKEIERCEQMVKDFRDGLKCYNPSHFGEKDCKLNKKDCLFRLRDWKELFGDVNSQETNSQASASDAVHNSESRSLGLASKEKSPDVCICGHSKDKHHYNRRLKIYLCHSSRCKCEKFRGVEE